MKTLNRLGLALIIAGPIKENIGRFVTTIRHVGERTSPATGETHDCWQILAPQGRPLVGYQDGQKAPSYYGPFPASWLMCIDGTEKGWLDFGQNEQQDGAA